jgi:hypothetical protein
MKFFKFLSARRIGSLCIAAVSAASTTVMAADAIIDDCEGGTNQNKFGAYWYFYDDQGDGGNSTITGAIHDPVTKKITAGCAPIATQGNNGTAGYQMNYTIGTTKAPCLDADKKPIAGCGYNYVGIGTMLATEGNTCDITGAATVTFWAKASAVMTLNVEVATSDITDFNYYRTLIPVTASWTQYTIILSPGIGIAQQTGWGIKKDFNPKLVTKIQWQVHTDQKVPTTGSLNLDDVVMTNYTFTPPEVCKGCLTLAAPSVKTLLSNFETAPTNGNAVGGWWYCYNDGQGRNDITSKADFSDINAGCTPADPSLPLGSSPVIAIDGHGNSTGNAAYIGFQLGKNFNQGTDVIKPFVGIGASLTDHLESMFYNGTADGVTGIMFDYQVTGTGVDYLRLEVVSSNDLSAQGIVWSRLFPAAATWQTAIVPFDSLKLPNWDKVNAMDPTLTMLKKNELKKLQFAVQDAAGKQGTIAIDNVYLIGASKITPLGAKVLYHKTAALANGVGADLVNRSVIVTLPSSLGRHIGTVSLVNIKGMRIASKSVNVTGGSTASLNVSGVATGLYFTVVKTQDLSGKQFSATLPVNIY